MGETKTSALMLCMTKLIHRKGKIDMMDSCFCIAAGIIAMHKRCVFGQALIKKCQQYWPHHVLCNKIDNYFSEKELGLTMTYWQEIGGIDF